MFQSIIHTLTGTLTCIGCPLAAASTLVDGGLSAPVAGAVCTSCSVTSRCQFHQHFTAPFSYKSLLSSFSVDKLRFDFFWRKDIGAKAARKTLVKLTTGVNFTNIL